MRRDGAGLRPIASCLALLCLCSIGLYLAFSATNFLKSTGSEASARWVSAHGNTQGVSYKDSQRALEKGAENLQKESEAAGAQGPAVDNLALPAMAFWREAQEAVRSENREGTAQVIFVLGTPALCFPNKILTGALPPQGDASGCAVTRQLAWNLWGSVDVVGLTLRVQGQAYYVRGVVEGSTAILLCPENAQGAAAAQGFTGLEVSGLSSGDKRTALETLRQGAYLSPPLQIAWTGSRAALATALCFAPLWAAVFFAATGLWQLVWTRFAAHRGLLLFTVALALALALPFLLEQVPLWLVPAKWSDSGFWSGLWNMLFTELKNALALVPFSQDILARQAFLQVLLGSAIALWSVCRLRRA